MSYLNYDGLAYFKSLLDSYFLKANYDNGSAVIDGNVIFNDGATFKKSITVDSNDLQHPAYIFGNLNGKAKLDWKGQEITSTYIKDISANDNVGTIDYVKGDGTSGNIIIKLMKGATAIANGEAGLVPAPASAQKDYFLRGDGIWAVPTDVYVNQNLIASSNNNQFPILLSGTSGTPATKTNATVGYTDVVSVNPLTNALMASQFISKHPTYNRQSTITSKVQYSLNFTDVVSGAGHNLGEVVGYIDTLANGGEHELGFRLFGNPNIQGTEEDYVFMGVGLSGTNVPYGHAPSTPLYTTLNGTTKRTVGTDIITRDWLTRNGSETGLVHTSMNETIDGTKTFVKKIVANDGMNATGNIATDTLTVRQDANVKGSLDVDTNLNVDGISNLHGKVTAGNGLEVTGNTKTTTLTVTSGTTTDTLNVTNGATISGGATVSTGNLTVTSGGVTASNGTGTFKNLSVTSNGTFGGTITANTANIGSGGLTVTGPSNLNGGTTTTTLTASTINATSANIKNLKITSGGSIVNNEGDEYVTTVINNNKTTVVSALIAPNGGLQKDSNNQISVKTGDGVQVSSGYVTTRLTNKGGLSYVGSTANAKTISVNTGTGLSIDNTGKINVDFEDLDPDEVAKIVRGMIPIKDGKYIGGLSVIPLTDEENGGKLIVDFSQMPQDKFLKLMNDMINAQQISSSGGKNHFYVDGINGFTEITLKDHLENDAALSNVNTANLQHGNYYTVGETNIVKVWSKPSNESAGNWITANSAELGIPAIPFKTIQACVNLITKVYKFNTTNSYINCQNIDESTMLVLPSFDRTTASIVIRACTFNATTTRGAGTLVDPTNIPASVTDGLTDADEIKAAKLDYLYPLKIHLQPSSGNRHCIETNGTGVWSLYNFDLDFNDTSWRISGGHQSPLHATDYSICKITTCRFKFTRSKETFWTNLLTTGQHVIFVSSYALCEINRNVRIESTDFIADETYINNLFTRTSPAPYPSGTTDPVESDNTQVGDLYRKEITENDETTYKYYCWNGGSFEEFSCPFNRVVHGFQVSDRATVRVQDTRVVTKGNSTDDRAVYFAGQFRTLINCSSVFVRNLSYMGKANVTEVTDTAYRFYIYAGGYVRLEDSGHKLNWEPTIDNTNNNLSIKYVSNTNDTWLGTNDDLNTDGSSRTSSVEYTTNSWYK